VAVGIQRFFAALPQQLVLVCLRVVLHGVDARVDRADGVVRRRYRGSRGRIRAIQTPDRDRIEVELRLLRRADIDRAVQAIGGAVVPEMDVVVFAQLVGGFGVLEGGGEGRGVG